MEAQILNMLENYSPDTFHKLMNEWSEEVAAGRIEESFGFRHQVVEMIVPSINKINLGLLRDLYLEQAKCAYEKCGVHVKFNQLGRELLERGGERYLVDFYKGAMLCQGTYIISMDFTLDREKAMTALDYLRDKITHGIDSLNQKVNIQLQNSTHP
jgi:hypothetical protein